MDEHACVTARVLGNVSKAAAGAVSGNEAGGGSCIGGRIPAIGFIAHLDTAPDCSGKNVKPQIFENYQGGEIVVNKEKNVILNMEKNPELADYIGHTIITSDGNTLLGADDKAGISVIMDALETLKNNPQIKHGDICVAFTPDEEVQGGAEIFDIEGFGADFAFTIDGDGIGEFNHETFNAADAHAEFKGICIHPGMAKDKMINPIVLAGEFLAALPREEAPETTEGREGFYYVYDIKGDTDKAHVDLLLRDFDMDSMEKRMAYLKDVTEQINKKWGEGFAKIDIEMQYYNMNDFLKSHEHIIEKTKEAYRQCGLEPKVQPIRGGTDGSTLSRRGLPTPNLFMGGHNYHSVSEFVSLDAMEKARDVVIKILELYAEPADN